MSNLAGVAGTIGTVVGVGFTLGALGLTLGFVDRAFDRATPRNNGKRKRGSLFDTSMSNNNTNMFAVPQQKRRRRNDTFGDFF